MITRGDDFFICNDVVVVRGHGDSCEKAKTTGTASRIALGLPAVPDSKKGIMETILDIAATVRWATPDDNDIYRYPTNVFIPTDFHTATTTRATKAAKSTSTSSTAPLLTNPPSRPLKGATA